MSASPLPEDELAIFDDFVPSRSIATCCGPPSPAHRQIRCSRAAANLPPSLDSSTVTKLQAIMPPSAIRELYTVYVADTRKRISEMERYSANGDEESLRRCAHALKGSAAMAGVAGIASIAAGLEAGHLPPPGPRKAISPNAQRL